MNSTFIANHLWQSTLFAGLAWFLTRMLRRNRAQVRYSIWMLASLKFLIPFSLLVTLGSQLSWSTTPYVPAIDVPFVETIGEPFGNPPMSQEPIALKQPIS